MKFFLCLLFSVATFAHASCTIDFENEISAVTEIHSYFQYVKSHKLILARKGFKLVSANGPLPSWTATISSQTIDGKAHLVMGLHSMNSSRAFVVETEFTSPDSSVQRLLAKMPSCN